jgi:type II secretory pathway pseudopilin PulG
MTVVRRGLVTATVVAVVVIAAALGAPRVLRRLAFFRVRQVEVIGAHYLNEADVARRLGLAASASTFDQLEAVRRAAAAIPGVVRATVEPVLPSTLRVTLVEAEPVAVASDTGDVVLIDAAGRALPFDITRVPRSLPVAVRDSSVAALLARVMHADPRLYATIESASLERGDVVFAIGARRIRVRPEADLTVLRSVNSVLGYLAANAVAWREIDARYRGRIFVQKGAA